MQRQRAAVFALYQHDLTGRPLDDVFERDAAAFTRALAHATADNAEELDALIERHAKNWTLDRIAPLEKAILRTALLEMLHPDLVEADTPIPPRARSTRPSRPPRRSAAPRRPASSTASSPPSSRDAGEWRRAMTEPDTPSSA